MPRLIHRRSIKAIYYSAIFGMAGSACISPSILSLAVIKLGGNELHLSIMQFAWLAPLVFGLLTLPIAEYKGKKAVLTFGYTLGIFMILPIMLVPQYAGIWSDNACIWLIILSIGLMSIANAMGIPGWFPILQDNIPRRLSGRFLGSFRTSWQVSNLIMVIAVSLYLGKEAQWAQFNIIFLIGIVYYIGRAVSFYFVEETMPVKPRDQVSSSWGMLKSFSADRSVRPMFWYLVSYAVPLTLCESFKIKMLKDFGYSDGVILGAVAMINVGGIISLRTWGRLADRYGNRFIFGLSHIAMAIVTFAWIFVGNSLASVVLVYFLHFSHSIFNGGNYLAQSRYLHAEMPAEKPSHLTIINNISFVIWGIAPFGGAAILHLAKNLNISLPGFNFSDYDLLYIITAVLFLIPHHLRRKLSIKHETPTRQVVSILVRPVAYNILPFNRFNRD
ncbi:MAG: MFS transporter [Sedimentisphaerales bacterium]|nr:MFS transporter [Sedimentisphaerales bacterium]MBN2843832.1 MFS transporter [Sedimentisphaerales bacterium]